MSNDFAQWLEGLGLGQYVQAFADNGIEFDVLPRLSDGDLKDLGLNLGDCRRLQAATEAMEARAKRREVSTGLLSNPISADAERRQVTVMFCDLVGSTALSVRLDPEDMHDVIRLYQDAVAGAVKRYDGYVAKYMGDGVLAYFGYPRAFENDAERAINVGLELVEAVKALQAPHGEKLAARIGIATGVVVVGDIIGEGGAEEAAITGETPNLAARLQGIAEPDTVVIGETTRALAGPLFETRNLGPRTLKGFGEPVSAWMVCGARVIDSRFDAMRGEHLTELVGRNEELRLLKRRWQQVEGGEGQIVLISGEPGIGKSRLARALQDQIAAQPHSRLLYQCSPHHTNSALYPVIERMKLDAGIETVDPTEARLDKLEAVVEGSGEPMGEAIPLLASLLSIPLADRYPAVDMSPQLQKQLTLRLLVGLLVNMARRLPVLLVLEDAHWVDPTTLELMEMMAENARDTSVLLLITCRPEFDAPWFEQPPVTLVILRRLEQHDCSLMVESVPGGADLPEELRERIATQTDGVPLFVEELTRSILETASGSEVSEIAVPTTLKDSLEARLDRLGAAREIAQIVAVIGREFRYDLVVALMPERRDELEEGLSLLVATGLVVRRGDPPMATYTFKHALIQDTAYGQLLRRRRREIHARVASVLEERFADVVANEPETMARHYTEAGQATRAAGYWLKAGERAAARSAMKEALAHLGKGRELVATLAEEESRWQIELGLESALGGVRLATGGFGAPEAIEAFERARHLCDRLNQPPQLLAVANGLVFTLIRRRESTKARLIADEIRRLGNARGDSAMEAMGCYMMGRACFMDGDFVDGRTSLEEGLRLYDPAHRPPLGTMAEDPHVMMQGFLAGILGFLGHVEQARALRDDLLAEARQLGQAYTLCYALAQTSLMGSALAVDDLMDQADELITIATERGFQMFHAMGPLLRVLALVRLGRGNEVLAILEAGVPKALAMGGPLWRAFVLYIECVGSAAAGRFEDALVGLTETVVAIETTQVRWFESEVHRLRGEVLQSTGDVIGAEASLVRALEVARAQSAKLWELRASMSLARMWQAQGKPIQAQELLSPIHDWFTEGLDTPVIKEAKALLYELR